MGLGMPKHEVGRPRFGPLFRDMEPARARYKNYVSDQRYHNAVDGMRNGTKDHEMGNLTVQIRIVFSTNGTLHKQGKETSQVISGLKAPLGGQDRQPDPR